MKRSVALLALLAGVLAIPAAAYAQSADQEEGVLVRVNGDAVLGPDETTSVAVVVRGDLLIEGRARTVVVVDGAATLRGATVETLVVVRGEANLEDGTVVSGDVWLADSDLTQSDLAQVDGSVRRNFDGGIAAGFIIFGLVFAAGLAVLAVLGALAFAAVAPDLARQTAAAIREDFGRVVLAGLVLWVAVPIVAGLVAITIIGLPTALAIWLGLMPALAFLGYIVTGIWLGLLMVARDGSSGHPYLAAFAGTGILALVGIVPGIGWIVGSLASLLGGSALALVAWRSIRRGPAATGTAA